MDIDVTVLLDLMVPIVKLTLMTVVQADVKMEGCVR